MRLAGIMEKERIRIEKMLIPSNGGLRNMSPNPFAALGLEQRDVDVYVDRSLGIEVVRKRGEDIPELCDYFTSKGIPVFGLTGDDLFDEYKLRVGPTGLRLIDTIDWIIKSPGRYSRPTLCFIGPEGSSIDALPKAPRMIVNKKYECTAREYLAQLEADYGVKIAEIRALTGKTESEIPERSDFGIEVVVSGRTLSYVDEDSKIPRMPKLIALDEIRQSDMSVITSWPGQGQQLTASLLQQYATIENRLRNPTSSLTSALLRDRNALVKKFGEECAELIAALARNDAANYLEEAQQAAGWLSMVGAVSLGIPADEFFDAIGGYGK